MVRPRPRADVFARWRLVYLVALAGALAGCDGDERIPDAGPVGPVVVGELGVASMIETWQGTPVIRVENSKSTTPFASQRFLIDTGAPDTIIDMTTHPVDRGFVRLEMRAFG